MRRLLVSLLVGVVGCTPSPGSPPKPATSAESKAEATTPSPGGAITQVPGFVRELRFLDVTLGDGARASLDALLTRPADGAPAPLVIINHGSPRDAAERADMSPTSFAAISMVFARRGYAVAVIMRRGFGATGGPFAEAPGPCNARDYRRANRSAAEDVLGAVAVLKREPWVDPKRIVLIGHSAGGMAVLGSAASSPEGVIAVVSFASGRGSDRPDHVCQPERLVDAVREAGATTKVPSLWIYAANDHFFDPAMAQQMFEAYRAGGAPAEIALVPAFADDGHRLFVGAPAELWWPTLAPFFAKLHLPVDVARPRVAPRLDPPPGVSSSGLEAFTKYLASENLEKAFAVGPRSWGWSAGRRTPADAKRKALANCEAHAMEACTLYAIGDTRAP